MLNQDIIEKIKGYFSAQPVEKVNLFGSYARSEQNEESDIDLLIEFNKDAKIGLLKLSRMKIDIENLLSHKVDILTTNAISPYISPFIKKDLIIIYEKSN